MSEVSRPPHARLLTRCRCATSVFVTWFALLLVSGAARGDTPPLFSFVQISDVHLYDDAWVQEQRAKGVKEGGSRNPLTTPVQFRTALTWVDAQTPAPAFMLLTGDIIEIANQTRYAALMAIAGNLRTPWIAVPGNHDYGIEQFLPADASHGGRDVVLSRNGMHFIGLATFNLPGMSQMVSRETLAKLASFCDAHPREPVVLFCHTPLVMSKGETGGSMVPANSPQVLAVVKRCGNVVAILCGHDHNLWSRVDAGVLYSCGPGFCDTLGGVLPYSFRVWRVYPDRLEGVVQHVTADGQVQQTESVSVTFPLPVGLRPQAVAESAPVRAMALPAVTGPDLR